MWKVLRWARGEIRRVSLEPAAQQRLRVGGAPWAGRGYKGLSSSALLHELSDQAGPKPGKSQDFPGSHLCSMVPARHLLAYQEDSQFLLSQGPV